MPTTFKRISRRNRFSRIKQSGGSIFINNIFKNIVSIGYEFECGDLMVTSKGLPHPTVSYPTPERGKFVIPAASETELFFNSKSCNTFGNYNIIISSEIDSPLAGVNETHSKIYDFEKQYLLEKKIDETLEINSVVDLLHKCRFDVNSDLFENVFTTHTEILFTIFNKTNSCQDVAIGDIEYSLNDEKCILNTMKTMIDILHEFFIPADDIFTSSQRPNECDHANMRLTFFKPNPELGIVSKPIYYAVPTFLTTPNDPPLNLFEETLWVPQMTYCVKVEDIVSVTEGLARFLTGDDLDHVNESIQILDKLMTPVYYEAIIVTAKTKKGGTKKSKKPEKMKSKRRILKPEFIEFCEKIKNVLFFAVYYFYTYYFYENLEGTDIIDIKNPKLYKNLFCFTFRHSIDEILNHYMLTNPDEMTKLNLYLSQNIIPDDEDISNKDPDIAVPKLISYVSKSFSRVVQEDYVYEPEQHIYDSTRSGNNECANSVNEGPIDKYIFSKMLKCESNYFDFDRVNETILIEYRCFHKNVIQSYNQKYPSKAKSLSIHKSLNEWKEMIDELHKLRK